MTSVPIATTADLTAAVAPLAPKNNPTFTGNVVVPTADADTEALNRITADGRFLALNGGTTTGIVRTGTGRPEGVMTAPVGTHYTDTAATNGAVEWVKSSGTGNTGWRVVYGDTGWRTLLSWSTAGAFTGTFATLGASFEPVAGVTGDIRWKMDTNGAHLRITNVKAVAGGAAGGATVFTIGANNFGTDLGFSTTIGELDVFSTSVGDYRISSTNNFVTIGALAANTSVAGGTQFTLRASSPRGVNTLLWPTVLPGVATP